MQDIPNCVTAFVMERLLPVKKWTFRTIDAILDAGDQLYKDSYVMYGPENKKLGLEYIIRKVVIKDVMVYIQVCKPVMMNQLNLRNLREVLEVAFMRKPMWLLNAGENWYLIFQREGLYYFFDPHDTDVRGIVMEPGKGCASVLRFFNIKTMSEKMYCNVYKGEDDMFCVSALGIKSFEKIAKCEC